MLLLFSDCSLLLLLLLCFGLALLLFGFVYLFNMFVWNERLIKHHVNVMLTCSFPPPLISNSKGMANIIRHCLNENVFERSSRLNKNFIKNEGDRDLGAIRQTQSRCR